MRPKLIISVSSVEDFITAAGHNPDLIEIRIDLLGGDEDELLEKCREKTQVPLIGTVRSRDEGGKFEGTPEEWFDKIAVWIPLCEYIDIERSYSDYSGRVKDRGKKVISSVHLDYMPEINGLISIEENLEEYGDIPKIIVTPESRQDILLLSGFTLECQKPVITGVMGSDFRWARALCCIFGSFGVFCHTGSPASAGQYHIDEMKEIFSLLDIR